MIDKKIIVSLVEDFLAGSDDFLVEVSVSSDNEIVVEIDSDTYVDIETCCELNRFIEGNLSRDIEDYSLEVGSSGLTSPFKTIRQYRKNIGNEIEVLAGGKKRFGILKSVGDDAFTIELVSKQKGNKDVMEETFNYADVDYAKYNLKFK